MGKKKSGSEVEYFAPNLKSQASALLSRSSGKTKNEQKKNFISATPWSFIYMAYIETATKLVFRVKKMPSFIEMLIYVS